jgi:hypothetical protein
VHVFSVLTTIFEVNTKSACNALFKYYHINMDKKITGRGGPGRGQGRKPLVQGEIMVPVTLKMLPTQREKLKKLGGAPWVRQKIDQAKE